MPRSNRGGKTAQNELNVEGHKVAISNPDKVLYRASGFTKADVIDYYIRVSRFLLPHLKDRPVTLKRSPDGVHGKFFYEKNAPAFTPQVGQDISDAAVSRPFTIF